MMVREEEKELASSAGLRIHSRAWIPEGPPAAVVAVVHGMAEHSGRYRELAQTLAGAGYEVRALDLRGHGRSEGRRLRISSFDEYLDDLSSLLGESRRPGLPLFLLGHSMGGLVALSLAVRESEGIDFLVLSGALTALPAGTSALRIAFGRVLSMLLPGAGAAKIDLRLISRDADVVATYMADPLVTHADRLPARLGIEIYDAIQSLPARLPAFRRPALLLHGSEDRLAPVEGSRRVYQQLGSPDKTLRVYEGLFHEVFNEPERETVVRDLLDWMDARR